MHYSTGFAPGKQGTDITSLAISRSPCHCEHSDAQETRDDHPDAREVLDQKLLLDTYLALSLIINV